MLEPTYAERARTALVEAAFGSLATLDSDGRPVVASVPIVDDGQGAPVTVLSNLSTHTIRAGQDARSGISLVDRLLLQGDLLPVPGMQQLEVQTRFLIRHPEMVEFVESDDFSWFRLVPSRVRWIDDHGDDRWLRPEDLFGADPDPLATDGSDLVAEIADRLGPNLLLMTKALAGRWMSSEAELLRIDRYGMVVLATEPGDVHESRIPFPVRLNEASEIHAAVTGLLQAARSAPTGKKMVNTAFAPHAGPERRDETLASEFLGDAKHLADWSGSGAPDKEALDTASLDSGLLDTVEGDGGGGSDIDGVDSSRHGDSDPEVFPQTFSSSLFDALEQAGAQTRAFGPQEDGDLFVGIDDELAEGKSIGGGGKSEQSEAVVSDDVESGWERSESGVGESESLTHGDPPAAPV